MLFAQPDLGEDDLRVVSLVEDLRQRLRLFVGQRRRWDGLLRRVSLARAVRGSNSIEGYVVSLDDAFAALGHEEPLTEDEEAWRAVRGYRDAMTYVLELAHDEDFAWSEGLLRSLHFMLQSYDLSKRPGRFRKGDVYVHDEDREVTVYEGPDADEVPWLVRELVQAVEVASGPAVVRGAMAHLNLVMIHPFKDGNGRMARVLQALVVAREGVLAPEFCSIEEYLGANERAYYDVLAQVGGGRWSPSRDVRPWIRFCLTAHYRQALTVVRRVRSAERTWEVAEREVERAGLPDRTVAPLHHAMTGRRLRNATYRDIEPEVSYNLASRDLAALVAAGLLEPRGEKRGRHYLPAERLAVAALDIRRHLRETHPVDADPYEKVAQPQLF